MQLYFYHIGDNTFFIVISCSLDAEVCKSKCSPTIEVNESKNSNSHICLSKIMHYYRYKIGLIPFPCQFRHLELRARKENGMELDRGGNL